MVRLKEFIQGGPDSRQEVHAALTLEDLQARHRQMLQGLETTKAQWHLSRHLSPGPFCDPSGTYPATYPAGDRPFCDPSGTYPRDPSDPNWPHPRSKRRRG